MCGGIVHHCARNILCVYVWEVQLDNVRLNRCYWIVTEEIELGWIAVQSLDVIEQIMHRIISKTPSEWKDTSSCQFCINRRV